MFFLLFYDIMDCLIQDIRDERDFRFVTFSNFKVSQVSKELITSLMQSTIEPSCYWSAELICSGHYIELWETIILFMSRYIHLGSPKLPIYISLRMDTFKLMMKEICESELSFRNNLKIRQMFAEIIATLCYSRKKHAFETVKIKKEEFSMSNIQTNLKAPNVSFAEIAFKSEDPKELFVAINEFSYHLSSHSKNCYNACYWLEWLLEFNAICIKNKHSCIAERRNWPMIESKYQKDCIWLIWDIIKGRAEEKKCSVIIKIIASLLDIFCLKYSREIIKKRKYLLYNCVSLLTDPCDLTIPLWDDKEKVMNVGKKINIIYKEIKKNEKAPKTEYLQIQTGKSNLDKTKEKLEKMNSFTSLGI
jgi:hypothetical protein